MLDGKRAKDLRTGVRTTRQCPSLLEPMLNTRTYINEVKTAVKQIKLRSFQLVIFLKLKNEGAARITDNGYGGCHENTHCSSLRAPYTRTGISDEKLNRAGAGVKRPFHVVSTGCVATCTVLISVARLQRGTQTHGHTSTTDDFTEASLLTAVGLESQSPPLQAIGVHGEMVTFVPSAGAKLYLRACSKAVHSHALF